MGGAAPNIRVILIWKWSEDETLGKRLVSDLKPLIIFDVSDIVLFIRIFKHEINFSSWLQQKRLNYLRPSCLIWRRS